MRRRRLALLGAVLVLGLLGGPAAAHDFTGSEEEMRTLKCPAKGKSVPRNQEPPGKGECDERDEKTYRGRVWTNNVRCGKGGTDAQVAHVYTTTGSGSGGAGVCNDGGPVPVQGRFVASGSTSRGVTAYADGDRDNSPSQLQGWARVDASSSSRTVRCGEDGGRLDATHATSRDGQQHCG